MVDSIGRVRRRRESEEVLGLRIGSRKSRKALAFVHSFQSA